MARMFQNLGNTLGRTSDTLNIRCDHCKHEAKWSAKMALRVFGERAVRYDITRRLRCSRCDKKQVSVWI
jgi:hypothetical protein